MVIICPWHGCDPSSILGRSTSFKKRFSRSQKTESFLGVSKTNIVKGVLAVLRKSFKSLNIRKRMVEVISLISIKGGVGKTTLSSCLASDLARTYGKKVLLIDANYSAPNLGFHMNIIRPEKTIHDVLAGKARVESAIYGRYGVDVIPGAANYRGSVNFLKLRDKISRIKGKYDFVVIDSSPSLNDELLSAMLASDYLFVVTTPDYPTLSCSLRAAYHAKQRGKPIAGIIINRTKKSNYELDMDDIEKSLGIPVVASMPEDEGQTRALYYRIPVSLMKKKGISKEIKNLNSAIVGSSEPKSFLKWFFRNPRREEINRQFLKESFYTRRFFSPYEKE